VSELVLDLDIGNSYTKWRLSGLSGGCLKNADIQQLKSLIVTRPGRIRAACVAGETCKLELAEVLRRHFEREPEFAISSQSCAGVYNGYQRPETLGIDRWLAGLAMWNQSKGEACLIIDAGSALTIDTIDNKGMFKGGYIIPGLVMMQRSLIESTGRVICGVEGGIREGFESIPTNTAQAVQWGASFAVSATVGKSLEVFLQRWPHGKVAITGGDGAGVAAVLNRVKDYRPDLVLDGLAFALP
jgi:type III pantothenate kinase